jgi:hypothetical protein
MDFFFWRDLFFAAKKAVIRFGCVEAAHLSQPRPIADKMTPKSKAYC